MPRRVPAPDRFYGVLLAPHAKVPNCASASRARVVRLVDFFQALLHHVRVNLSRRYVRVAQHQLDRAEVRATLEQMRGETVAQLVRRQAAAQAEAHSVIVQNFPDADAAHSFAGRRQEQNLAVRRRAGRPREFWPPGGQILFDGFDRFAADGHEPFLVSLADAAHAADAHVDVGDTQIQQFRNAQPSGIQNLEHRAVPQADRRGEVGGLKQLVNFVDAQIGRQAVADLRRLEILRWVQRDQLFLHAEFIEAAYGNEEARHRAAVQFFLVQAGEKVDHVLAVHVLEPLLVPLFEKRGESSQVPPIGQDRVLSQAALDAHVTQKDVNGRFHSVYPVIPDLPDSAAAEWNAMPYTSLISAQRNAQASAR